MPLFSCCLWWEQTSYLIFIVTALRNSLNGLLLHESDADMSALSDGGLEK